MKVNNIKLVEDFLAVVDKCKGDVKLCSIYGDSYNLKSKLSQYVAISALLGEHGEELELFCDNKEDEKFFLKFFYEHPEVQ